VPGVLEDGEDEEELDEELDELEPVGACCACSVGASTRPVTRSANAAAIGSERYRVGRFRLATIRFRRSQQV